MESHQSKQCPFSNIYFTCKNTDCRPCQVMRAFQEKVEEDEFCPVPHCRANLRVWHEMGLGPHLHYEGEGK